MQSLARSPDVGGFGFNAFLSVASKEGDEKKILFVLPLTLLPG
jgi:hypothetical protein